MLNNHPFKHWVPPRMPPRFSLYTDLTLGVNAPLVTLNFFTLLNPTFACTFEQPRVYHQIKNDVYGPHMIKHPLQHHPKNTCFETKSDEP